MSTTFLQESVISALGYQDINGNGKIEADLPQENYATGLAQDVNFDGRIEWAELLFGLHYLTSKSDENLDKLRSQNKFDVYDHGKINMLFYEKFHYFNFPDMDRAGFIPNYEVEKVLDGRDLSPVVLKEILSVVPIQNQQYELENMMELAKTLQVTTDEEKLILFKLIIDVAFTSEMTEEEKLGFFKKSKAYIREITGWQEYNATIHSIRSKYKELF